MIEPLPRRCGNSFRKMKRKNMEISIYRLRPRIRLEMAEVLSALRNRSNQRAPLLHQVRGLLRLLVGHDQMHGT